MEYNEITENLRETNCKAIEKTEPLKDIMEDFFERLEQEKIRAAGESKAVAFGSANEVKDSIEKYEKAKEEYNYRVKQLDKSISKGEKSFNESIDVKYAKKAVERAEIDLKYAKKYNS